MPKKKPETHKGHCPPVPNHAHTAVYMRLLCQLKHMVIFGNPVSLSQRRRQMGRWGYYSTPKNCFLYIKKILFLNMFHVIVPPTKEFLVPPLPFPNKEAELIKNGPFSLSHRRSSWTYIRFQRNTKASIKFLVNLFHVFIYLHVKAW